MTGAISQDRERCQFLFCWIKIPMLLRSAWTAQAVVPARKVPYGAARSNSERAAPSAGIGRRYSAVRRAEPGYCEHCARARSFQAVGVRRRGHGRWGVCPALELQIRTADFTGRSCSDELSRVALNSAVRYSTPQAKRRLAATLNGGEMRQG
jgi:hypothetical protein